MTPRPHPLLKELRLRLFALRVLVAIHAHKAKRIPKATISILAATLRETWRATWRATKSVGRITEKALQKTGDLLRTIGGGAAGGGASRVLGRIIGRITAMVVKRVIRIIMRFFLPALVKTIRTSVPLLVGFLGNICLKYPRPLVGSALVLISLLSLSLSQATLATQDATEGDQKTADKITLADKPRLSLLPQAWSAKPPPEKQQEQPHKPQQGKQPQKKKQREASLPSRIEYRVVEHAIRNSLYETALEHGIALPLLRRFVDVMSYDVDFQREIWAGARFRMLLSQRFRLEQGGAWQPLGEAVLEMAELYTGRKEFRFHRSGWDNAFYDEEGKPAKRLLRRTPMSGLRLTSRFGMRRHPILGYTRMHKGVDFAAPRGTPVLAAGDGVVRKRVYGRGYGRYVLLKHNDRLSTLYAHMRSFARGVRVGSRVRQGQVIGYVGSSGMSTGAHLHYEIHRDGRAVNPRRVKLPEPKLLAESKRSLFDEKRGQDEAWLVRGGSVEATSAVAALQKLGCGMWRGMCDGGRQAQK